MYVTVKIAILFFAFIGLEYVALGFDEEEAWKEFKSRYAKNYTRQEEAERKRVFLDNKRYIDSYNTKSTGFNFSQGINSLSDLTTDEINNSRNGFRLGQDHSVHPNLDWLLETLVSVAPNFQSDHLQKDPLAQKAWYENIFTPEKLDYRAKGRVSKVKDQGSCGSCWAFATTGALESVLASRNRATLLSEQNLIDCSGKYGNYGCSGGLMDAALSYVRDHGIMSSSEYQYTGKNGFCQFVPEKSIINVRGSATLPRGNEILLRMVLALTGPLPIAIDAGNRSFHSYKSGVYDDKSCMGTNDALNHAVLLVGYGTDDKGGDYWLIKNSWGNKWGDNGYIKIARNRGNLCGVASFAVLPIQ